MKKNNMNICSVFFLTCVPLPSKQSQEAIQAKWNDLIRAWRTIKPCQSSTLYLYQITFNTDHTFRKIRDSHVNQHVLILFPANGHFLVSLCARQKKKRFRRPGSQLEVLLTRNRRSFIDYLTCAILRLTKIHVDQVSVVFKRSHQSFRKMFIILPGKYSISLHLSHFANLKSAWPIFQLPQTRKHLFIQFLYSFFLVLFLKLFGTLIRRRLQLALSVLYLRVSQWCL